MEKLDRGMMAVHSATTQAYVGWRLLGDDPAGISFNVYRAANGGAAVKLNASPLATTTDFIDGTANFTQSNAYFVRPVIDGVEQAPGETFTLPANTPIQQYLTVPLQLPPGGSTLSGAFTYTANDTSVGDLDGDQDYEMVVKWDPTNSKDNSQAGHTGDTLLDAYQLDGSLLWRINFGPNIRSGAHYMDFMVYDFDGDGRAEIMCRTAPGTKDGTGSYVGGAAKWQGGSRPAFNDTDDYRNSDGYILTGPEFLTVFDGLTGAELATVRFFPQRDPDNLIDNPTSARLTTLWGDGYGNRFDRFLAAVAYVDGQRPSGIFCRGYYTRSFVSAYDWRGGLLTKRWSFDSATNPSYAGQGAHSISVGDLDGDGKDEIAYGACAIDDNGTGLWNSGLGHGDATHLSEMDPDSPGLKFFMPHESPGSYGIYGTSMTEQRNGQILWGAPGGGDVGRGAASDIDPRFPGYEAWATNSSSVYTVKGVPIPNSSRPSVNFAVWWDADPLRELLDSNKVDKWNWTNGNSDRLLTMSGISSNNSTKATPNLSADILGDWREEILLRTTDNTAMRIYTTINPATSRLYTLLHDPQYRVAVAWQNTGYNQPPHPGFFLGQDMAAPPRAPIWNGDLVWQGAAGGNTWDAGGTARWLRGGVPSTYVDGDSVLLDHTGNTSSVIALSGTLTPGEVIVHNAIGKNYTFGGTGSLGGAMTLTKAGLGSLTVQNTHDFTGATLLQQGDLVLTGTLAASQVTVEGLGRATGTGTYANGLIVKTRGRLAPGPTGASTLNVGNRLDLTSAFLDFDIGNSPAASSDAIAVTGNLNLSGVTRINLNRLNGTIGPGSYPLITYTGTLTGTAANFSLSGLAGAPGTISVGGGTVTLTVLATRAPGALTWRGSGATWNLASAQNWLFGGAADYFVTGDTVTFNNTGAASPTVTLVDELIPSSVSVDATGNYTFSGSGMIGGSGGLTKADTGKLTVQTANTYTGATVINGGVLEVATVGSGGVASTLGAASASSSNLVFNGGTLRFTGSLSSTNRGATLSSGGGTLEVVTGSASLIISGPLAGTGALTKTGAGTLNLAGVSSYSGGTWIKAGTVLLGSFDANEDGVGTGLVTLDGGTLSMTDLQSNNNCSWPINVPSGSTGRLNADGRCSLNGALTGGGVFTFHTPYVRTALSGNWSAFTGQINVVTDSDGGDFRINNSSGYANAAIDFANLVNAYSLTGSTSVGEVSGDTGAVLSGTAWTIGAKNTDATFDGTITGNSVNKIGSGSWTLTGAHTYTGATTVTGGTLFVDGSLTGSNVTVQNSATLSGSGTIAGNVSVLSGGTIAFEVTSGGTPSLQITGNLTTAGNFLVSSKLLGGALAPGTYNVLSYTGTFSGSPTFVWSPPPGSNLTGTVVHTPPSGGNPGTIAVTLVTPPRGPAEILWVGTSNATWDAGTLNWSYLGNPDSFRTGDTAVFDETGNNSATIALTGSLEPAVVRVNATKNYVFGGTGTIIGNGTLEKNGSGTLTISNAHSFTGGTTIRGGTLATSNAGALGSGTVTLDGGTWATGALTPNNPIVVTANSTITGGSSGGAHGIKAVSGSGTLTLTATNIFDLEGTLATFSGRVVFNGSSSFRFFGGSGSDTAAFDLGTRTLNARSGNAFSLGSLEGVAGSVLQGASGTGNTTAVTYTIGGNNLDAVFSGNVVNGGGSTSLVKTGTGTLVLAGANTYTGATTVSSGKLSVTGSLAASATTVAAAATLGGTGTIAGSVTCNGTLAPGNSAGTLILSNGLVLAAGSKLAYELGTTSDRTTVTGNLTLDGTLDVSAATGFAAGTYTLITHTGALTNNILAIGSLPAGFTAVLDTSVANQVRLVVAQTLTAYEQWQIAHFGSIGNPDAAPGADPDGDGQSNEIEFAAGTDPKSGTSRFTLTISPTGGDQLLLTWFSVAGKNYQVQSSSAVSGGWAPLATVPAAAAPATSTGHTVTKSAQAMFYRVAIVP
ncbi:MAG: autotransporter-associated beta strand repeat-containing protein [Verrucomicrobiota bacterium]